MAALGLRCCTQASSSLVTGGSSLVVAHRLLAVWLLSLRSMGSRRVASECELSSCGAQA